MSTLAFTELERIAFLSLTGTLLAAIGSIIAAWISAKTRKENVQQHGDSQLKLQQLHDVVHETRGDVGDVKGDVAGLKADVGELRTDVNELKQKES